MTTFKITKNIDRTYDRIFKAIDQHSLFKDACAEREYEVEDGYVIEINSIPAEAYEKISRMRNVVEI